MGRVIANPQTTNHNFMHTRQSILAAIVEFCEPRKLVPTPDTILPDNGFGTYSPAELGTFLEDRYGISITDSTTAKWTTVDSVIDTVIAALPYAEVSTEQCRRCRGIGGVGDDVCSECEGAGEVNNTPNLDSAIRDILTEFHAATANFPQWPTDPLHALAVVQEEVGEVQKEVLQLTYEPHKSSVEKVRKEAIQMAAMSLRFLLSLDAYKYAPGEQHEQLQ